MGGLVEKPQTGTGGEGGFGGTPIKTATMTTSVRWMTRLMGPGDVLAGILPAARDDPVFAVRGRRVRLEQRLVRNGAI